MVRVALAVGIGVALLACDGEVPASKTEPSPEGADSKTEVSPEGADSEGSAERRPTALWPWVRAKERAEAEAEAAMQEARAVQEARVTQERKRLEQKLEALDRELEVLEDEGARVATPTVPSGSPSSPAEAPMSRPEPEPTVLAGPPWAYTLVKEAPLTQGPTPKLKKLSGKRNGIIDEVAWFHTHGLSLPVWDLGGPYPSGAGPLPETITKAYRGEALRQAIEVPGGSIGLYSVGGRDQRWALVRDPLGDALAAFDFSSFVSTPVSSGYTNQQLRWAQAQDGVLFACTYHMTYASSSGGLNAFITAVQMPSGELLWQSEPLVCNSHNFLLRDGWIITGYGFTAEPDFLYVLDGKTGETVSKTKVASGPEVILESGDKLYVRTYNRDYVFALR